MRRVADATAQRSHGLGLGKWFDAAEYGRHAIAEGGAEERKQQGGRA